MRWRYQVECVCGCGGFGAVYRAIDIVTGTPVALKENHHHRTFPRFEGEARLLMNLTHPHLPKVRSVFFDPSTGRAYMVMDFVAGETLEALVKRRGRLSWQEAQPLFSQLVAAIAFLHQHGIVHRDIKPANIIVQRRWTQAKVDEWEEVVLPPPALTEKQVARMSDATRFQRGRAYWQDGWRLQGLKRHGWTLGGTCLGGESPEDHLTYQVWAMLGNNGVVARFCDCPDFRNAWERWRTAVRGRNEWERKVEVQVIRLGEAALVGVSGELFVAPALWLKCQSPFPFTFVIGYANGYNGYLTTQGAWAQGGYEVSMGQWALCGDGSGERVAEQALRLLRSLIPEG